MNGRRLVKALVDIIAPGQIMQSRLNRREFGVGGCAMLGAALRSSKSYASADACGDLSLQPRSAFNVRSTAEEVTAGLDLSGKTILITGCNAGIGYETMRVLVLRGAHVHGLARSLEQASKACGQVIGSGVRGTATPFACEHTDFSSIVNCANAVKEKAAALDAVICNAGIYFLPKLELVNGLEKQFVVNHLAHFILVNRLLEQVRAAKQGRIVVVVSIAHSWAPGSGIEFDNLAGQRSYDPMKTYGQSKLANGLFTRELARRLSGTQATANVLHPGSVMTETMRKFLGPERALKAKDLKTPQEGAATTCYVASNPALYKVNGLYFADCSPATPDHRMCDDAMATRLWRVSEELTKQYLGP